MENQLIKIGSSKEVEVVWEESHESNSRKQWNFSDLYTALQVIEELIKRGAFSDKQRSDVDDKIKWIWTQDAIQEQIKLSFNDPKNDNGVRKAMLDYIGKMESRVRALEDKVRGLEERK